VWRGIAGLLIGQWQAVAGGGMHPHNARCQVMWQKGGWSQTGGVLNARRRVTWQSRGWKDSGRWARHPRRSTSSDMAARRAVADQGRRPRRLTSWRGKAEGARVMANRGRCPRCSTSSDVAERRAGADRERRSRHLTSSDVAQWRVRAVGGEAGVHVVAFLNPAHIFWGRGTGDGGGRWR